MPVLLVLTLAFLAAFPASVAAAARVHVFGFYGWGDNFLGSSRGIDQIAAQARTIPGVVSVRLFNYWDTQTAFDQMRQLPASERIALYGYSCGANAITSFFNLPRPINTVAGLQQSLWCGGYPIAPNVRYAQQTYGGCLQTLGLGCKQYAPGPGFRGRIRNIRREERHGPADTDPDYQRDVLIAIAGTARALRTAAPPSHHPPHHGECPSCTAPPHH